ncbi:DoxX family protein [Ornithinimicrobium faecis]|uniref:DoxX family protein n=1 Tax=Ornithinimicrobium faecis TaxID=2934158 RepID=UPI0021195C15|nr:DoxX family protein [Ornithinimicrobium sp. HY1745]
MNIALWIVAGLLATGYLMGGTAMLVLPKERYFALHPSQEYVELFPASFITALGGVKILGAVGLILPAVLGIAPGLVPWAALGFVLLMTGATTVRIIRQEWPNAVGDLVFLACAAFVAWGRFGPEAFVG